MNRERLDAFAYHLYQTAIGKHANGREWWDRYPECRAFYRKIARAALAYQSEEGVRELPDNQYPYIRAWGRLLGSYPYYINNQVEDATQDGAPQTAIFKRDGVWQTIEGVKNPDTKARVEAIVALETR